MKNTSGSVIGPSIVNELMSKGHHVEIVVKGGVYYTPKGIVK